MHHALIAPTQAEQACKVLLDELAAAVTRGPGVLVSSPADDEQRAKLIDVITRTLQSPHNRDLMPRIGLLLIWAWEFDCDAAVLLHDILRRFSVEQVARLDERGAFDA